MFHSKNALQLGGGFSENIIAKNYLKVHDFRKKWILVLSACRAVKKSPGKWCSWSGCIADTWRCSHCPLKNKQKTVTFKGHRRSHRWRNIFSKTIHFKEGIRSDNSLEENRNLFVHLAISNEKIWNLLVYCPFRQRWGNIIEGGHDFSFSSYQPTPQLAQLSRAYLSYMPLSKSSFSLCSLFLEADEKEEWSQIRREQKSEELFQYNPLPVWCIAKTILDQLTL